MSLEDLKEGDTVFLKFNMTGGLGGYGFEATITEVRRKWAVVGPHGRFDRETGMIDGGYYSYPGDAWRSRAECEAAEAIAAAWADLKRDIQNARSPAGLTVEAINEIRQTLGLDVLR